MTVVNQRAVCYKNLRTGNVSVDWKANYNQTIQRDFDGYKVLHERYCYRKKDYKLFVKEMKQTYKLTRS